MIINNKEMKFKVRGEEFHCAMDVTMNFIGGKWKTVVLWYLRKDKKRFGELRRLIPGITEKMLSLQLKQLEQDGIVDRVVYPEVPPVFRFFKHRCSRIIVVVLRLCPITITLGRPPGFGHYSQSTAGGNHRFVT